MGAVWQHCRVHLMRNMRAHVPKGGKTVVAAVLRTIFAQGSRELAVLQLNEVVAFMRDKWPRSAEPLAFAEDDILAYLSFPIEHWTRIYSAHPLERLNKEIKRRTNVVGIFPDDASALRLAGAVLKETGDEWQVGRRYFSQDSMRNLYPSDLESLAPTEPGPLRLGPGR